jgi:hypothetical protein
MPLSIFDVCRAHDSADLAGSVSEIASTRTVDGQRLVTAVRAGDGALKLISWQINTAGPVTRLGDSGGQAGSASSIDIARGNRYVVACRDGDGDLKLISWTLGATGQLTRAGDSGGQAGTASLIKIVALSDTLFVVACRDGDGDLKLISWRLNSNGSLTRLGDSGNAAGSVSDISMLNFPGSQRIVTSVRDGDGDLKLIVWDVSTAGAITRRGDSANQAGEAMLIRSAVDAFGHVVTSVRDGSGDLKLITWNVSANGLVVTRLKDSGNQAGAIGDNSLVNLPDGVVSAVRTAEGSLRLIAWSIAADGTITRRSDSADQAGTASLIQIAQANGIPDDNGHSITMVTPVRTASGTLKLISWGPTLVRVHFKILTAPTVGVATMLASMQQVYATAGITVRQVTTENLNLPLLNDLDVGSCTRGNTTTEQNQLFANRNNVGPNDVVAYFVRSTNPPLNGCAAHPSGRPSVVVTRGATQWTLGHEIGHTFGLNHVNDNNRLMTGNGTANITNPPPDLIPAEVSTAQGSSLTQPV